MPKPNTFFLFLHALLPPESVHDPGRLFEVSLFFGRQAADGILDAHRKDDIIKKFITNSSVPEIDVDVKKVALEDMQSPPYKARVDFYMVYYSPSDHSEIKRDLVYRQFVVRL